MIIILQFIDWYNKAMEKMEKTLVLIKPDALQRCLMGEIISRFERKGLKLVAMKMVKMDEELLKEWYFQYKDAEFFPKIASYMSATPIIAMVWEGYKVQELVRRIIGTRKGYEAEAGSIRGDLGMSGGNNLVHASDSLENVEREIKIIFNKGEIFDYKSMTDELVYSEDERNGEFR